MRTCPTCGTANRIANGFCVGCGIVLPRVDASSSRQRSQTQFSLPDYLRRDAEMARRRQAVASGSGAGLAWTGMPLAVGALLWSSGSAVGNAIWALGLLMIVTGFWRMRHDRHAMGRAGLVTSTVGAVALGVVVFQLLKSETGDDDTARVAVTEPTVTQDWERSGATPGVEQAAVRMFGGGPEHTGQQPGPGPTGRPVLLWRVDTGGELYSTPAVVDGALYLGTKSGFMSSLDAATGKERWRSDLGGYIVRSSPAVVDDTVYAGAGYALFALDAATGEERWRLPTRFAGSASPVVVDGNVYAATQEGHVYAADARTGHELWHIQLDGLVFSGPAVSDGRLFLTTDDGSVFAIDIDTGRHLWDYATDGEFYASPAVASGTVWVSNTSGTLVALDAVTGSERWRAEVGGDTSPAVVDGMVYLAGEDGGVHAVEAGSGLSRWLFPTGHQVGTGLAIVGDTLYLGSGPTLHAVDRESGEERWKYPTSDTIESGPTVVGGTIYIGSRDGYLFAIGGTESTPASLPS